jgi:hypothetical protein
MTRRLYRVSIESDKGFHVGEHCTDCGQNVQGAGHWVPRRQVPQDPATLPLLPTQVERHRQGELFLQPVGGLP